MKAKFNRLNRLVWYRHCASCVSNSMLGTFAVNLNINDLKISGFYN